MMQKTQIPFRPQISYEVMQLQLNSSVIYGSLVLYALVRINYGRSSGADSVAGCKNGYHLMLHGKRFQSWDSQTTCIFYELQGATLNSEPQETLS